MPYYIQRREEKDTRTVVTIEEYTDSKEAYAAAREYNRRNPEAVHYVTRRGCKAWYEKSQ
jgi:hypothetical protein